MSRVSGVDRVSARGNFPGRSIVSVSKYDHDHGVRIGRACMTTI